ncbi:uncharacterized protein LOC132578871 [Heteronotia binoei]|uniref:uncharacterized protein LOC132578871 n=1 Tax=Heteronotia binoei TaxID=13085 RepID=UPI00292EB41A|nr:uncharacterized protein LOC132578871 [Heteronotia binoei]
MDSLQESQDCCEDQMEKRRNRSTISAQRNSSFLSKHQTKEYHNGGLRWAWHGNHQRSFSKSPPHSEMWKVAQDTRSFSYNEELYETEIEDRFSYHGETNQSRESSTDDENEEFHTDFEGQSSSELPDSEQDAPMEAIGQKEMSQKAFLDSVFGELPPESLIKINFLFPKPPPPPRRPQTKHSWFSTKDVADEERSQEVPGADLQKDEKLRKPRKRYLRIGGMLAMPVPVEGPLFADQEM